SLQRLVWHTPIVLITLILVATPSLFGQAAPGTSTIGGLVTDPSGAVIPGAEVVVRNVDTNVRRELTSNEAGLYVAGSLQPRNYEFKVTRLGFAAVTRTGVWVAGGQRVVVDLEMQVGAAAAEITIEEGTPPVETTKTDVSTVINLKDMMNLPMSGRRWDSFALSTPGTSNDGGFGLLSFRGVSGLYNNNMMDGMEKTQAFF